MIKRIDQVWNIWILNKFIFQIHTVYQKIGTFGLKRRRLDSICVKISDSKDKTDFYSSGFQAIIGNWKTSEKQMSLV